MPYRRDRQRFEANVSDVTLPFVGQGVIWRRYISASGVTSEESYAGFGEAVVSAENMITAFVGVFPNSIPRVLQNQTPAGMIAAGETFITTQHRIDKNDEIVHRGAVYRVDSEPQFVVMTSAWAAVLKRGNP